MKKIIFRICIAIIILICVCGSAILISTPKAKYLGIENRTLNCEITDNNVAYIEDIIEFHTNMEGEFSYSPFPSSYLYHQMPETNKKDNIAITINGKKFEYDILNCMENNGRVVFNLDKYGKENTIVIKANYGIYVDRYNNTDVLKPKMYDSHQRLSSFKNLTINIKSKCEITQMGINFKNAKIKRNDSNSYTISVDTVKNDFEAITLSIDNYNPNIIEEDFYYINDEEDKTLSNIGIDSLEDFNEMLEGSASVLLVLIGFSFLLLLISIITNCKNKIIRVKNYRKDTNELISPVLAEAVIDGKIDLKEYIMTTIIELSVRGNIKIINNSSILLLNFDNLEGYERILLEFLFTGRDEIKISDINEVFLNSEERTIDFHNYFQEIKELIIKKLCDLNIFSKELTKSIKIINLISILSIINTTAIVLIPILVQGFDEGVMIAIIAYFMINVICISKFEEPKEIKYVRSYNEKSKKSISIIVLIVIWMLIAHSIIEALIVHAPGFLILILIEIIINILILVINRRMILTKNGVLEKKKLLELKKYIKDYSLMKNRDLADTIIWDRYLAYATSFKIPSNVTNKIFENWYNIAISLRMFEDLIINFLFY